MRCHIVRYRRCLLTILNAGIVQVNFYSKEVVENAVQGPPWKALFNTSAPLKTDIFPLIDPTEYIVLLMWNKNQAFVGEFSRRTVTSAYFTFFYSKNWKWWGIGSVAFVSMDLALCEFEFFSPLRSRFQMYKYYLEEDNFDATTGK
jgi:hypothetical protein